MTHRACEPGPPSQRAPLHGDEPLRVVLGDGQLVKQRLGLVLLRMYGYAPVALLKLFSGSFGLELELHDDHVGLQAKIRGTA